MHTPRRFRICIGRFTPPNWGLPSVPFPHTANDGKINTARYTTERRIWFEQAKEKYYSRVQHGTSCQYTYKPSDLPWMAEEKITGHTEGVGSGATRPQNVSRSFKIQT